jgi:hypothetical protein
LHSTCSNKDKVSERTREDNEEQQGASVSVTPTKTTPAPLPPPQVSPPPIPPLPVDTLTREQAKIRKTINWSPSRLVSRLVSKLTPLATPKVVTQPVRELRLLEDSKETVNPRIPPTTERNLRSGAAKEGGGAATRKPD